MGDLIELKVATALMKSEAGFGRVRMDSASFRRLNVQIGDVVEIVGKRSAVAKVMKGAIDDEGKGLIRMDGITRSNAGVTVDESVRVRKAKTLPAEKIIISPIGIPAGKKISFREGVDEIFKNGLMNRPVLRDNEIVVPNIALMGNLIQFKVITTVPVGIVVVDQKTEVTIKEVADDKTASTFTSQVSYEDIGGLEEELKRIREMIELPIKHPELFDRLGITAPKGVLLYGPPGTGKTLIAKAVAKESGASFFSIQGPEIMGSYYGQSEERLRNVFDKAEDSAPSIVFIDEIDSIAPNRNDVNGEVERRVVAQLLTLMDGLSGRGDVIVIAATNREESIDPALRRPGRFDREIEIGIPGRDGRKDILAVHLRSMPLDEDVSTDRLANLTQGFVGADLAALAREAAMKCLTRNLVNLDLDKPIPQSTLISMKVNMNDFMNALSEVEPSGMREVIVDIPKVGWSDVGGFDSIKKEIRETFIPTEERKAFEHLGIKPPRGVLLYGPPGTGKTLIAKAVANESGSNFICVNGPELTSKWMGESEKAIRQIFKRAKQMAPCIIFFDEIDSITPKRGTRAENASIERMVNQILTSMDGIEGLENVTVMAATNRPDMMDPALLRPGRFDKMILVGKPDLESRLRILEVHTKDMPLINVDLIDIAELTDGYVGADLQAVCREAGMAAFHENPNAKYVDRKHFMSALDIIKPSVDPKIMDEYYAMASEMMKRKTNNDNIPFWTVI
ncbi:CDC48 family AAA ATPase [Candidatus Methanarcanum hacksteinii]|uniref:CDC48 family AAA ATPase n=1 Tax=Candidatus Methanarcanum hacksteinii TaxID=2911857 RepID=UPI0037DCDC15